MPRRIPMKPINDCIRVAKQTLKGDLLETALNRLNEAKEVARANRFEQTQDVMIRILEWAEFQYEKRGESSLHDLTMELEEAEANIVHAVYPEGI